MSSKKSKYGIKTGINNCFCASTVGLRSSGGYGDYLGTPVIHCGLQQKQKRTPLVMAEGYGPLSCSSCLALESTLSHSLEIQYGLVSKLSHYGGKNLALCALKNQVSSSQDNQAQRFGFIAIRDFTGKGLISQHGSWRYS